MPTDIDFLTAFPFLNEPSVLNGLKKELPANRAKANEHEGVGKQTDPVFAKFVQGGNFKLFPNTINCMAVAPYVELNHFKRTHCDIVVRSSVSHRCWKPRWCNP